MARVQHCREAVRSRDDASNHSQATQQCYHVALMNSEAAAAAANEDNLIRPYVHQMKERLAELEKLVFSRRFSSEKSPTITVASFFRQTTDLIVYVPLFTETTEAKSGHCKLSAKGPLFHFFTFLT